MKELLIALLIVAAVFLVSFFAGPTGFAASKFDKLSVSGGHALLTPPTFSPNGDGVADIMSASVSGRCDRYHKAVLGVFSLLSGDCATGSISLITSTVSANCAPAGSTYCQISGYLDWNGKNPSTGNKMPDGTYCVISGCTGQDYGADLTTRDKTITININSKLYPAKSTYTNGVVCGSKPTCKGSKTLNMLSGCDKTPTQNAGNMCYSKGDTCVKSDTGSCKFDGVKCLYDSSYCCKPVNGNGICQATTVAAVPGGK